MIKMDMIWIAVASMIYPSTAPTILVSQDAIENKVHDLFSAAITPVMISRHLVSWVDRMADKSNPKRGGSRNRYLFRTVDGHSPSSLGDFRLNKLRDSRYDGQDKTALTHPEASSIPEEYRYLLKWYIFKYFDS